MAVKTIYDLIMLRLAFGNNNRLGEAIKLQRSAQQPLFRRCYRIGVVIVGRNIVLFDPHYAVDGLIAKRTVFMYRLTKRIDGVNSFLFCK